ncbi:MAG: hypothetical protein KAQ88_01765 [Hyphomicrobiaceae bacterium]|jgi:hypothetical protein|nr:hypothetical protein [Hyphomicrobiaceae bacterium]
MAKDENIPRLPALTDRTMVSFREGSLEVLEGMAADAEIKGVGVYIRLLVEREIAACRPEDFKRLRGVG